MSLFSVLGNIAGIAAAPFTGGASLIPGLISTGADVAGTLIGQHQISNATNAQKEAIGQAIGDVGGANRSAQELLREGQKEAYGIGITGIGGIQQANAPYQALGSDALMSLKSMLQGGDLTSPVNFDFGPDKVKEFLDPSLQFTMDEAMKALSRSAAGRGALRSGGTAKELLDYGQKIALQKGYQPAFENAFNVAQQRYSAAQTNKNNAFNRVFSLAGMGQQSTQNTNQALQSFYQSVMGLDADTAARLAGNEMATGERTADLRVGRGDVSAAGSLAQARNLTGGLGNIGYDVGGLISLKSMMNPRGGTPTSTDTNSGLEYPY